MQYTMKYQRTDQTLAIHCEISTREKKTYNTQSNTNKAIKPQSNTNTTKNHAIHNQISTKQQNAYNTQSNTNKKIKPMQYRIKYQQNDETHAIHNEI